MVKKELEKENKELKGRMADVQAMIEVEAKKLSDASLDETKEVLIKDYERKFDEYKDDITGKFSNFLDGIIDEEFVIPPKVLEFAKKGELYSDLIEQFKIRLGIDEGLLDEEVKSLLKEAKEEIISHREQLDKLTAANLEEKKDAQELAAQVYLYQKCQGLSEEERKYVFDILGDSVDRAEIDRKFKYITEWSRK